MSCIELKFGGADRKRQEQKPVSDPGADIGGVAAL
jgi:hypothetical protein